MTEAEPSAAKLDPERELRPATRIYECSVCDEQIAVTTAPSDSSAEPPPA
jgi:hypothetical protein